MVDKDEANADKRQIGRIPLRKKVEVSCDDFQSFKVQYAENISTGGMYLTVDESITANSEVQFRLSIKDIDQEISGEAKVVWTKESLDDAGKPVVGMGIKFTKLDEGCEEFIKSFIDKHVNS